LKRIRNITVDLILHLDSFGNSGGEGTVYRVTTDTQYPALTGEWAYKRWFQINGLTPEDELRRLNLRLLIDTLDLYPPFQRRGLLALAAWPQFCVLNMDGTATGFLMNHIDTLEKPWDSLSGFIHEMNGDDWLTGQGLDPDHFRIEVFHHVTTVFALAHRAGFAIRDVNPENVVIFRREGVLGCQVIDIDSFLHESLSESASTRLDTDDVMVPENVYHDRDHGRPLLPQRQEEDIYKLSYLILLSFCPGLEFRNQTPSWESFARERIRSLPQGSKLDAMLQNGLKVRAAERPRLERLQNLLKEMLESWPKS